MRVLSKTQHFKRKCRLPFGNVALFLMLFHLLRSFRQLCLFLVLFYINFGEKKEITFLCGVFRSIYGEKNSRQTEYVIISRVWVLYLVYCGKIILFLSPLLFFFHVLLVPCQRWSTTQEIVGRRSKRNGTDWMNGLKEWRQNVILVLLTFCGCYKERTIYFPSIMLGKWAAKIPGK